MKKVIISTCLEETEWEGVTSFRFAAVFSKDVELSTVNEIADEAWNRYDKELDGAHDYFTAGRAICWNDFAEEDNHYSDMLQATIQELCKARGIEVEEV